MSGAGAQQTHRLWGRRPVAIAVVIGIVIGSLFAIAARDDGGGGYLVRAVFDNGSFVIPGEDVKIAGVKVGTIHDVDLTDDNKAAVVLQIDDPAFVPFRKDAQCQIRLQSLIGEQFIECKPTRPHKEGEQPAPALAKVESGRGKGEYLLPADNNVTPVGADLLQDISRMPQREGFRLLINELGAGLAGNGTRLRAAVRRANPALKELDGFVKVLAGQNRELGQLVDNSDTVLASWVKKRKETAGFIDNAGATGEAAAARGDDIERSFQRFPAFLRELTPTTTALTGLANQMTPALDNLESQAPAINATIRRLGPFTAAATPGLVSLGKFGDRGRQLFPAIRPLVGDLNRLGKPLRPTTDNLAKLFGSFDDSGGIEELMKLIYFYTGSVNGVDDKGHYVRSSLAVNGACLVRRATTTSNCQSTLSGFGDPVKAAATMASGPKSVDEFKRRYAPDGSFAGANVNDKDVEPMLDYLLGPDGSGK